ncbi:MAG: RDD family protein [Raineya sp.]|jgi:uncharacterized RDD family membrane protein YckC|nr:RDD family protein [Raineya sp.]
MNRIVAIIIDGMILLSVDFLIIFLVGRDKSTTYHIISKFVYFSYFIYGHSYFGQTIGKAFANIKVVSFQDENELLNIFQCVRRESIAIFFVIIEVFLIFFKYNNIILIVSLLEYTTYLWIFLEIITMLFNKKQRSIHDLIANSVVINLGAIEEEKE